MFFDLTNSRNSAIVVHHKKGAFRMEKTDFYGDIADYVFESWRLRQYTADLVGKVINSQIQKRGFNQIRRFDKHSTAALEKLGVEVLDFTGEKFDTGLPVYPINLDDFQPDTKLVVEMMLEPTIKKKDSAEILKKGAVVVGRANNEVLCGD